MIVPQLRDGVTAARVVLIALFVATLFSTSLGVGLEIVAYVLFAALPQLRKRLLDTLLHPAARFLIVFLVVVFLGALHGAASWGVALSSFGSWRRVLLFFLALAVFDTVSSKKDLLSAFLLACVVAVLLSYLTLFPGVTAFGRSPGIVLHNYATQGMVLSVGAAVAALALFYRDALLAPWFPSHPAVLIAALLALVGNVVFVMAGRSGYLALLVLAAVLLVWLARGRHRAVALIAVPLLCVALLASGQVRERLSQGIAELQDTSSEHLTSMGVRLAMWNNALRIIQNHPIVGVGTGGFENAFRAQVAHEQGWRAAVTNDPHNQFLKIWAEQGLIGLVALLAFIVSVLATKTEPPYRQLAAAVLLAWCATSLFNSHFSTFVEGRFLFFWLGAMLSRPSNKSANLASPASPT